MTAKKGSLIATHTFEYEGADGQRHLVHAGTRHALDSDAVRGREGLFADRVLDPNEHRARRAAEEAERERADPMMVWAPCTDPPEVRGTDQIVEHVEVDGLKYTLVEGRSRFRRSHPVVEAHPDYFVEADRQPPDAEER